MPTALENLSALLTTVTTSASTANAADASVLYQIADRLNSLILVENASPALDTSTGKGDFYAALAKRLGADLLNATSETDRAALLTTLNSVVTQSSTQYAIGASLVLPAPLPIAPSIETLSNFACVAGIKEQYGDGGIIDYVGAAYTQGFTTEWGVHTSAGYWERFLAVLLGQTYVPNTLVGTQSATLIPTNHRLFRHNDSVLFREEIASENMIFDAIRAERPHFFFKDNYVAKPDSNNYSYPRLYFAAVGLTNTTASPINVNLNTIGSAYTASYSSTGIVSFVPNQTNDLRSAINGYTFVSNMNYTSTNTQYTATTTVSIPANKSVLFIMYASGSVTSTTYFTFMGQLGLRKPSDMLPAGITCDLRLTSNLLNFGVYDNLCDLWTDQGA